MTIDIRKCRHCGKDTAEVRREGKAQTTRCTSCGASSTKFFVSKGAG